MNSLNSSIDTLIVTAHPDDETIFFTGPMFSRPRSSQYVLCVTDGNADENGTERLQHFKQALSKLGVSGHCLGLPDHYEKRLNIQQIHDELEKWPQVNEVFTHNIQGEYGHPHHQDVSFAVHSFFNEKCKVLSTAYNCYPDEVFQLNEEQWQTKFEVLSETYWSETHRFQQVLPCTWSEGFSEMKFNEVASVYKSLTNKSAIDKGALDKLKPYGKYLEEQALAKEKRPF